MGKVHQEVMNKKKLRHGVRAAEDRQQDGKNVWVLTLPLQQLKPVKTSRRRHGQEEGEEVDEEAVTPKGEGCRIPAAAETCPPAPKKPRTAVLLQDSRRCNDCDGEALEFFRVPVNLEAVFASLSAAKAN
ncbi:hypothetical protein QOZ80_2AG0100740 [Eleusine coracana subsp. coracana]|nr:hypothetical protein QOZ80_2AG0100740 [Eleusine coracana subsp. coracana]